MTHRFEMTIGGESVPAENYTDITNPADLDEVVGQAPTASKDHLDQAIFAARKAFPAWSSSSEEVRSNACNAIAEIISSNSEELATLLTGEQGKPYEGFGSRFEIQGCIAWAQYTANLTTHSKVLEDSEQNKITMLRRPLGVVASITPWNWPLLLGLAHILPGIRTGNTVVIKPSPYTPLSTLRLIALINEVVPPGVVNVVSGGNSLGAAMTRHSGIDKIVFTGSIPTGKKVMESAAQNVTPLTLELGGNDAGIILPGTDLSPITERLFWGAMINSGQTCGALKRLYVHEDDYTRTCKALTEMSAKIPVGNGRDPNVLLGPIQNGVQFEKVTELISDAKAAGASVLCGGTANGGRNYIHPTTLIGDISDGIRLVDEEQFGPVLPIIRYSRVEDAIAAANATEFGLDASVWGEDMRQLQEIAEQLEAGTVFINKHAEIAPHVPLGGIKCSGLGVAFGQEGMDAYTSIKVINQAV